MIGRKAVRPVQTRMRREREIETDDTRGSCKELKHSALGSLERPSGSAAYAFCTKGVLNHAGSLHLVPDLNQLHELEYNQGEE